MVDRITVISTCESREYTNRNKNYEPMSKRLVYSIRSNGGKYKDCNIIMWYASEAAPSEETQTWLRDNGCSLVTGETLIQSDPVGNKIVACNTPVDTEFSMWMDSDMYVLSTKLFEDLIDKDRDVAATGSEYEYHRWGCLSYGPLWEQLYALAEVSAPLETFVSGLTGKPVHYYFNSAIVLFRNGRGFAEVWKDLAVRVRFSGIDQCRENFTQTSLTLAALKTMADHEQLPQTYNAYYALEKEASLDSAILHYQDAVIDFDLKVKWDV